MKYPFLIFLLLLYIWSGAQSTTSLDDFINGNAIDLTTYRVKFDPGKANLKMESLPFLDSIASFLKKNKEITISAESHTDTRFQENSSIWYSTSRSDTIVLYLISQGIDKSRLTSFGMNDSNPLIPEEEIDQMKTNTEKAQAHKTNERVIFKIMNQPAYK